MKKNMYEKIIFLIIVVMISCSTLFQINALAAESSTMTVEGFEQKNPIQGSTGSISKTIVGVLRIIGGTVAIVMLLVIAMKYMSSAPSDRADIKKHAIAYVIGAIILFGVTGILSIIIEVSETIK